MSTLFESNYYRIERSKYVMFSFFLVMFESNYYRIERHKRANQDAQPLQFESNYYRIERRQPRREPRKAAKGLNRTIIGLKDVSSPPLASSSCRLNRTIIGLKVLLQRCTQI